MGVFGRQSFYVDNPGSAKAPTINDDSTRGFEVGSSWYDTRFGINWVCNSATAGAALWSPMTGEQVLATLIGGNMNITTDQPFLPKFNLVGLKYAVSKILVTNASIDLTAADGGVYSAAAKGGVAIVAAAQVYTALATATALLSLTIAAAGSASVFSAVPILSLTGAQGAAATADFYLIGNIIPLG